jgi:hypothetical protein
MLNKSSYTGRNVTSFCPNHARRRIAWSFSWTSLKWWIMSRVEGCVRDLQDGFWIGWLDLLAPYTQYSELHTIIALSLIYTFYSSPLHTHYGSRSSLVVSCQRIYDSLTVTTAHMKSSLHSLFPFLPFLLNHLRLPTLTILSQAHIPAGWRLENQLTLLNWTLFFLFERTTQKTLPLYCWKGVFTAPLHSNGSYSIVACVFFAAGMCLTSRCLAMNVHFDFTIPTFGRHITM